MSLSFQLGKKLPKNDPQKFTHPGSSQEHIKQYNKQNKAIMKGIDLYPADKLPPMFARA